MKKLASVLLITGLTFSGVYTGSANAMTGNSLESVKALQNGDQEIEGVAIGEKMGKVLEDKGKGIHTTNANGKEEYYEYHTDKGQMIVTANGAGRHAKVKRISMSYDELNGPKYDDVKKQVSSRAIMRLHFNNITGNSGYISDGPVSYQFTSSNPHDKTLKLYRIDLEAN
ncbi:SA0570 family protein [Staphylococcus lutrae]|uniref:DUF3862 domain-containing protein n=1 Tax=Staphylococcus lutrae TaxID=155085 RepID=A0AAC9WJD8_9STAP|nr:hypothetical protein [Staphylococcus lutrae]ARJ51164.1 hypothetical protein B5P37_07515 [Staphylococcus lutrae]PNZ37910.1 hypothetical protein CD134_05355 [Staphylococcus lutrae]